MPVRLHHARHERRTRAIHNLSVFAAHYALDGKADPHNTIASDQHRSIKRLRAAAIKNAYGLAFQAQHSYSPTFMYRALETKTVDVISAFSSDGRIAAQKLTVLADPNGAAPSYDAVILLSPRRAKDDTLRRALSPLLGSIAVTQMR